MSQTCHFILTFAAWNAKKRQHPSISKSSSFGNCDIICVKFMVPKSKFRDNFRVPNRGVSNEALRVKFTPVIKTRTNYKSWHEKVKKSSIFKRVFETARFYFMKLKSFFLSLLKMLFILPFFSLMFPRNFAKRIRCEMHFFGFCCVFQKLYTVFLPNFLQNAHTFQPKRNMVFP